MRVLKLVLVGMLCTLPLLAQPQVTSGSSPGALAPIKAADNPLRKEAIESRPLFFDLTAEQKVAGQRLEFRVEVNGNLYAEETVFLGSATADSPVFELFARNPAVLDRLYKLGGDAANRIAVQVLLDGRVLRELSFRELVRYNRQLKQGKLSPQAAPSEVRDHSGTEPAPRAPNGAGFRPAAEKGYQPDPACLEQCDAEYWDCINNWGCDYGDCSRCQSQYDTCVYYCPTVCVDPKSVRESTTTELVGWSYGHQDCLEHWWEDDYHYGEWYQLIYLNYKHTTVRRTEYCDGSSTEEVVRVWYSTGTCWNRTYFTCHWPWSKAWNIC